MSVRLAQVGVLLKRLIIVSTEISQIHYCWDRLKRNLSVRDSLPALATGGDTAMSLGLHARLCKVNLDLYSAFS